MTGDYFGAMSIPLLKGRSFGPPTPQPPAVVLVSHGAAKQFWSDAIRSAQRCDSAPGRRYQARVVGVVGDVRHETLDRPARAELFLPHAQTGFGSMSVVVRTSPGSPVTIRTLKEQVWALDPGLSIYSSGTLDHLVSRTLTGRRFNLFLLGGFERPRCCSRPPASSPSSVSRRRSVARVRGAHGPRRQTADIVRLVVMEAVALAAIGVAIGVAMRSR